MTNQPKPTPALGKEADQRVNAFTKQRKTHAYGMKSEFGRGKQHVKKFFTPVEKTRNLFCRVFVWTIGVPILVVLIAMGMYWGFVDVFGL